MMNKIIIHIGIAGYIITIAAMLPWLIDAVGMNIVWLAPLLIVGGVIGLVTVGVVIDDRRERIESRRMRLQYEKDSIEFGKILRTMQGTKEAKA